MTTQTQPQTVDVEHNGETISVPTTFESDDVAAWWGEAPPYEVDRVFVYDDVLRAESFDGETYVEIGYWPEGNCETTEQGWLANEVAVDPEESPEDPIGETVWIRGD